MANWTTFTSWIRSLLTDGLPPQNRWAKYATQQHSSGGRTEVKIWRASRGAQRLRITMTTIKRHLGYLNWARSPLEKLQTKKRGLFVFGRTQE